MCSRNTLRKTHSPTRFLRGNKRRHKDMEMVWFGKKKGQNVAVPALFQQRDCDGKKTKVTRQGRSTSLGWSSGSSSPQMEIYQPLQKSIPPPPSSQTLPFAYESGFNPRTRALDLPRIILILSRALVRRYFCFPFVTSLFARSYKLFEPEDSPFCMWGNSALATHTKKKPS